MKNVFVTLFWVFIVVGTVVGLMMFYDQNEMFKGFVDAILTDFKRSLTGKMGV